jgi:hypothetical protein
MSDMEFEIRLHTIARSMSYPRTPDIAGSVTARLRSAPRPRLTSKPFGYAQGRTLAWSLTLIVLLCSSLMLIPPARAAILEFIQIGIVRIFPRPTEPPVEVPGTATPESMAPVTATANLNALPLLDDLNRFAGERTLSEAQDLVPSSNPIRLPAYPPDLGEPDRVFVQEADGVIVILVWLDPAQPERVLMSLHRIPDTSWMIRKFEPQVVETTSVNGRRAIWAVGPYPIILSNGESDYTRLIDGHVLIWEEGGITYRLETRLPLEAAIKIAESLEPAR